MPQIMYLSPYLLSMAVALEVVIMAALTLPHFRQSGSTYIRIKFNLGTRIYINYIKVHLKLGLLTYDLVL